MVKEVEPFASFEEAVAFAREWIASRPPRGPLFSANSLEPGDLLAQSYQDDGYMRLLKDPERLVNEARQDANMYLALKYGTAKMLYLRKPLPAPALVWLQEFLQDRFEPPKLKRGTKSSIGPQYWIYYLVEELLNRGMTATRNEERAPKAGRVDHSACDAVARALNEAGHSVRTYRTVKEYWEKIQELHDDQGRFEIRLYEPP